MTKNNKQEIETQECPKCGAAGSLMRQEDKPVINIGFKEGHAVREPDTSAEIMVCASCGHDKFTF